MGCSNCVTDSYFLAIILFARVGITLLPIEQDPRLAQLTTVLSLLCLISCPYRLCKVSLCPVVVNTHGANNYRELPTVLTAKLVTIFSFENIAIYLKFFPFLTSVNSLRGKHPSTANSESTFFAFKPWVAKINEATEPLVTLIPRGKTHKNNFSKPFFAICLQK